MVFRPAWGHPNEAGSGGFVRRRSRSSAVAAGPARAHRVHLPRLLHPRGEDLPHLAIDHSFLVPPQGIARHHPAPEVDRVRITQVLGDLPGTGESVEDQLHRGASDAQAAAGTHDEKLGHAVLDRRAAGRGGTARHHGEPDALLGLQDDERIGAAVAEPPGDLVGLAMTHLAEPREEPRVLHGEVIQVFAVDAADPEPVALGGPRIAHADCHGRNPAREGRPLRLAEKVTARTGRTRDPSGPSRALGSVSNSGRATYYF